MSASELLSAIAALFAVVVSLFSYFHARRQTTTESITTNRMDWIREVRGYCKEFLIEFGKEHPDIRRLKELNITIQLYGYGNTYTELFRALDECVAEIERGERDTDQAIKERDAEKVLRLSQEVLNGVWWRMKREAGISKRRDMHIYKQYRQRYGK